MTTLFNSFNIFKLLLTSFLLIDGRFALKVKINDRKLYRVIPQDSLQQLGLIRAGFSPEVILWSGMGGVGEPVEYLAAPHAMEEFVEEKLTPLNLTAQVVFPHVKIMFDTATAQVQGPTPTLIPTCTPTSTPSLATIHQSQNGIVHQTTMNSNGNPIRKIPGTNLFTGVWYIMRMKRFPQGFVTWTDATNDHETHYFIQIDLNPGNLPHYRPGGKWYNDVQWQFAATEDPSWYMLNNKVLHSQRGAITTWSYKEVGSGYRIIASTKREDIGHLSAGGKWRADALWKPFPLEGKWFGLRNKHFPSGSITWTDQKYGDHSHYIQVDTKSEQRHYARGGKWFIDSEFSFEPADDVEISASISQFRFMEMPQSVLSSHKKSDGQSAVVRMTLMNPSSATYSQEIEESFSKTSSFSYGFEQSLKVFMKVTASFSVPLIASGAVEAGFEASVGANQQFTKSSTKTYSVRQTVSVPPHASVEVSAFSEWIEDLEVPFNATMVIRGTKTALSGDFIKNYLTAKGETYNVISSASDHLVVNVRGKFKGTFGFRGIVSVEDINKARGSGGINPDEDYQIDCNLQSM